MKLSLVVLAAGIGSRYGGLKQLDPVGPHGEILLDYSVTDALKAGFTKVIFVIRREMLDLFSEAVGARYDGMIEIDYAFQELEPLPGGLVSPRGRTKPWGTGHAVLAAAPLLREPFAIINADDYYGASGFTALAEFLANAAPCEYAMVSYQLEKTLSDHGTVSRGICREDETGYLIDITERTAISRTSEGIIAQESNEKLPVLLRGNEPTSMNFWGLMPDFLEKLERGFEEFLQERGGDIKAEFYLPAAVSSLIGTGEATVRLLRSSDPWFGLTYPEDRVLVSEALKNNCR